MVRLVGLLSAHNDPRVRSAAVKGISALAAPGYTRELLVSLRDPDSAVRITTIMVLAQVDDPAVRARIAELASDPDEEVREVARRVAVRTVQ